MSRTMPSRSVKCRKQALANSQECTCQHHRSHYFDSSCKWHGKTAWTLCQDFRWEGAGIRSDQPFPALQKSLQWFADILQLIHYMNHDTNHDECTLGYMIRSGITMRIKDIQKHSPFMSIHDSWYNHHHHQECGEMGMGSFLAVSRASNLGARLIHLTYSPGAPEKGMAWVLGPCDFTDVPMALWSLDWFGIIGLPNGFVWKCWVNIPNEIAI